MDKANTGLYPNQLYSISTAMDKTYVLDCSLSEDPARKYTGCLWRFTGDKNQKFLVNKIHDDFYEIVESFSGRVMQVKNSKINNGAKIVFEPKSNRPNEWWQLIPVKKTNEAYKDMNAFYFRSFCGKTIDVKHAKATNDAEVFQYDYNGN